MVISFTKFKDLTIGFFDWMAGLLAVSPRWVQGAAYMFLRGLTRGFYYLPGSYVRKVAVNLSAHSLSECRPRVLYFGLVDGLVRMLRALEALSRGGDSSIVPKFVLPKASKSLLDERVGKGAILAMPHSTGSLLAVRELAQRYDVLMLIKEPRDVRRADRQRRFLDSLGCSILDVRRTDPGKVARIIFKALKQGKLVIGTSDRIRSRPPHRLDVQKETDTVHCKVLGQSVGVVGWPARFAHKCGLPILPIMPINLPDAIELHIGAPVAVKGELVEDTQLWVDALLELCLKHPEHWMFAYDKKWARVLRSSVVG